MKIGSMALVGTLFLLAASMSLGAVGVPKASKIVPKSIRVGSVSTASSSGGSVLYHSGRSSSRYSGGGGFGGSGK